MKRQKSQTNLRVVAMALALCCVLFLLVGCAGKGTQKTDAVTWQGTLQQSGAPLLISGCQVTQTTAVLHDETDRELMLLEGEACPIMTLPQQAQVELSFVNLNGDGSYSMTSDPVLRLIDYQDTAAENDTVQYRLTTLYYFCITVTTEQGSDRFLITCGGREKYL